MSFTPTSLPDAPSIRAVTSVPPPPTFDPLSHDPATQSNPSTIYTTHVHLDWIVDWDRKIIHGSAKHDMAVLRGAEELEVAFDTRYLDVSRVEVDGKEAKWEVGKEDEVMGSKLSVKAGKRELGAKLEVKVEYSTTDKCTALGWMGKEQTASNKLPFLFSQCQAIHARSLLPCQDSPSVKLTYSATVHSPHRVLMSARPTSSEGDVYSFDQPVAISSYLIAIAGGALEYAKIGDRTGVWADPERIKEARKEFEDTEDFLEAAEKIARPYVWGTYDVLLLPESFPYGGMENSNLTFVTPTLLAGDKSLVDVVAHEISHSWFGNLISCHSWVDFWLNEGWTTYLERLILRSLHGESARSLVYLIGAAELRDALALFSSSGKTRYQRLVIPYADGEDPDEAFSVVPYEKGSNFLLWLERYVGKQAKGGKDGAEDGVWWRYVKAYVDKFAGSSIGTKEWRDHMLGWFEEEEGEGFRAKLEKEVDWEGWLHGEGNDLPVKIEYDTTLADQAWALSKRWEDAREAFEKDTTSIPDAGQLGFSVNDLANFSSNQTVLFLEHLATVTPALPGTEVDLIGTTYGFSDSRNVEISMSWFKLALRPESRASGKWKDEAAVWVRNKGRMKFCRPTFRAINKLDPELAKKTFEETKTFWHPIARAMLEKDLGIKA